MELAPVDSRAYASRPHQRFELGGSCVDQVKKMRRLQGKTSRSRLVSRYKIFIFRSNVKDRIVGELLKYLSHTHLFKFHVLVFGFWFN